MKVENVHLSPNFGMAIKIFDPHSADDLKRALQSKGDMVRFVKLVKNQKNNEFNIGLSYVYDINKKKLRGCIYDGRSFYKEYKEDDFASQFLSPLNFIKMISNEADKFAKERHAKITNDKVLDFIA